MVRKGKKDFFEVMIAETKNSSTTMWKILNKLLPNERNKPLPNIIEYDGIEYDDGKTMAEAFNKHFTSVGRRVTQGLTGTNRDF